METIYDTYGSADAANEVCGQLEFDGRDVFVREIDSNTFAVIIVA